MVEAFFWFYRFTGGTKDYIAPRSNRIAVFICTSLDCLGRWSVAKLSRIIWGWISYIGCCGGGVNLGGSEKAFPCFGEEVELVSRRG